ncbi:MAG: MmcQ/YjbR family DNA-binding protein [Candidatus Dormibacterales bacterium]
MKFEAVRDIALMLPGVEESTSYGTPSFKVRKKFLARLREEDVLVVMIDLADKEFLIRSQPAVYFSTPHYDGYPAVLVRLSKVKRPEITRLLAASHRFVTPARSAAARRPRRPHAIRS